MSESPVGLGFVLLERPINLDASRLVSAARELGLELTVEPRNEKGDHKEGSACFRTAGGQIALVTVINGAHPDAPGMPTGLLSPSADEIAAAKAHAVVTLMGVRTGLEGALETARLVAATCAATPSVAAMLSHGVTFHRAAAFQRAAAPDGNLVYLLVDVTVARESADRISLLTHGLARYDREEFYITSSPQGGDSAVDFTYAMVGWMLTDREKTLPTGDTIGRSAEEKLLVQRVDSPLGDGSTVIKLDMP